jgi:hypothetical protein
MLESLITSKTRLRLLVKFFINAANNGYLRGLSEEFNESSNAIRKELNNLSEAGYLSKAGDHNRVVYKANIAHPLFKILQKIVYKHIGLDIIIEMVLHRIGDVKKVIIIGDYANGNDSGTIEVVLQGDTLNESYIKQLAIKIEQEIKRKVIFYLNREAVGLVIYEEGR